MTLRERLAQMHAEATSGTGYGRVDARVAAALVAVADAAHEHVASLPAPIFTSDIRMREAIDALAAALGVSR